jgi:molybdopterin-containing oxidoreductase family molybdopterin binding subunit
MQAAEVAPRSERDVTKEDVWIPSACSMCYSNCGIVAHRVNGTVIKIEGNPANPVSAGRICSKGLSSIMTLYDPNRVNTPLKRTNPEKGLGIDPKWQRISWEEALDIVVAKMRAAVDKDPRSIITLGTAVDLWSSSFSGAFHTALGAYNGWMSGAGPHCGNGEHAMAGILHGAMHTQVDYDHCNYLLMFGCGNGSGAYYNATLAIRGVSEGKARGMRLVVIDPLLSPAAERADEWVPIRPGTDGFVALAMLNCLINEFALYDAAHLREHTNAPYLIRNDGRYARDQATGKPLVWDAGEHKPKPYDDPSLKEAALLGGYPADEGSICKTAFQCLADHVRGYPVEEAEKTSTIPAATIRRLAREFGEAARIGSTVTIDGHNLPHRPVGVLFFKGAQAHKHSLLTAMAISLLTEVVGAVDTPGGLLGSNPRSFGFPETGRPFWGPTEGPDGMLNPGLWGLTLPSQAKELHKSDSVGLGELVPLAIVPTGAPFALRDPEKYELPYKPEVHFVVGSNAVMTMSEVSAVAEGLKKIPFTVSFNLYLDETSEFADVVLPDACFLERYEICSLPVLAGYANSAIIKEWSYYIRQPASEPLYERRFRNEVMLEIAERLGVTPALLATFNMLYQLREPYALDPDKRYTWTEMIDAALKSYFGPAYDLEWFRQHGVLTWPKSVEESYWKNFMHLRVPIYFEWFLDLKQQTEKLKAELSYGGEIDASDYQPLPDWKPCPAHEEARTDFDTFAFYYRVPMHTFGSTYNNAWLDDISSLDRTIYGLTINTETARKKGIKNGDWIWIESIHGGKVKGRACLTEGIHPEAIAMANNGGHWSKYLPIASQPGKGACFEQLMKLDWKCVDWTVHNWDLCVKTKVYKA